MPLIADYVNRGGLLLMQDNAKGYAAKDILAFMRERGLVLIFWPALSLDLNPIETLWNRVKDIIEEKDPEIHKSYLKLKAAIVKAWNSILDEEVKDLIEIMYDRCQAMIDADRWHTKY